MKKRRRMIKNIVRLSTKIVLSALVFYFSLMVLPVLQAFWENSGVVDLVSNNIEKNFHREKYAVIGDSVIELEIVSSQKDRAKGLSGRLSLLDGKGMWFIFNRNDYHGIWMKDMNFNIDIVWVDNNMKIVHIEEDVSPSTYPTIFIPSRKARYILELPANYVKKAGIKISDQVDLL